eukprot:2565696-Amphidinium_carterae.1
MQMSTIGMIAKEYCKHIPKKTRIIPNYKGTLYYSNTTEIPKEYRRTTNYCIAKYSSRNSKGIWKNAAMNVRPHKEY